MKLLRDILIVAAVFVVVFTAICFVPVALALVLWAGVLALFVVVPVGAIIRRRSLRSGR
ncbi:MAG TPA: hypothetical protein VNR37_03300 [Microbacteriaceae bacterium]|nr:hypothetical protein [Microbacteriaceae bacterium]